MMQPPQQQMYPTLAQPSVPVSATSFSLNLSETIEIDNKTYLWEAYKCSDWCRMCCCPCCPFVQYTGEDDKIVYYNDCLCCCQDWLVRKVPHGSKRTDVKPIGGTTAPGCCDNGVAFCLCPWLNCTGHVVMQQLYSLDASSTKTVVFTLRRNLFPCWPLLFLCSCCGLFAQTCGDCYYYCNGKNYVVTKEDLYPPQQGENGVALDDKIENIANLGTMQMVDRVDCFGCFPCRTPIKYNSILNNPDQGNHMSPVTGLIALIYRGLPVPCKLCTLDPVSRPTGVSCIDTGRKVITERKTMEEVMADTGNDRYVKGIQATASMGDGGYQGWGNQA